MEQKRRRQSVSEGVSNRPIRRLLDSDKRQGPEEGSDPVSGEKMTTSVCCPFRVALLVLSI